MRKIGLLAFLAAMLAALPAMPANKPIYSMWSPTYRGMTRAELQDAAIDLQREEAAARERYLTYLLIGLAGVGIFVGFRYLRR